MRKIGLIRQVFTGWGVAGETKSRRYTRRRRICDMNPAPVAAIESLSHIVRECLSGLSGYEARICTAIWDFSYEGASYDGG